MTTTKKIIIGFGIVVIGGVGILNYNATKLLENGIYKEIVKNNESKSKEIGGILLNVKRDNINCSGLGIYNCEIKEPTFGINNVGKNLFKAKNLTLNHLTPTEEKEIKLSINKLELINPEMIQIKDTFPIDLKVNFYQNKENYKINIFADNNSLKINFNSNITQVTDKDVKINGYILKIKNKKIDTFIYDIYKSLLENQPDQFKEILNKSIFGIETKEVQTKEKVLERMEVLLTEFINNENEKEKIEKFLTTKGSVISFDVKNKTGITVNNMINNKENFIDNFNLKIGIK